MCLKRVSVAASRSFRSPLGFGASEVLNNPTVARVAARLGCTPAQARLAWELASPPFRFDAPEQKAQCPGNGASLD
jgi:diketogulonate reductase-like aldo/keto reductase